MTRTIEAQFFEHATAILRSMLLSREGDLREARLVRQGRGSFQLSSAGHESVAAMAAFLGPHDLLFPAYRDRALMHARGRTALESARDFFARAKSSSGGRNLPGHFSSRALGIFSITSPVGAQCLPAVGAAWAMKLEGRTDLVTCHIGDAASRQGEFFEAVAQALADNLPVLFVVEDNAYGISMPTRGKTPLDLQLLPSARTQIVNGRDARDVFRATQDATTWIRQGKGPRLIWLEVDRLSSHTNADDHRVYRSADELESLAEHDPVERLVLMGQQDGWLSAEDWAAMQESVATEVADAYAQAEAEAEPETAAISSHLFGPLVSHYPILRLEEDSATMLQAFNRTLRAGLEQEPRTILFGEDIEDPKGGVFGITRGLSASYPTRVVNSPLAEATICGVAVGLSVAGWRPVFELQFVDFVGPALNQLTAQVNNLRWRTSGDWSCPMVLYAPYGAYLPNGGMWHSQANDGMLAGLTGLRVAVPSCAPDAAGLLWTAMHDNDPSIVLLPKHLLRAEGELLPAGEVSPVRWGSGRIVRAGRDATLVAWGNLVPLAEEAADFLEKVYGLRVEIVDPRTLVPCDWALIAQSVRSTGRLVVVQEDTRTGGFGASIIAEMTSSEFASLRARPVLISRPDVFVPFATELEAAVLPSISEIVETILDLAGRQETSVPVRDEVSVESHTTLTVPQLGEGLRHVRILDLLKKPGDWVALDEPLYEAETDKANVVVESSLEGTLVRWFAEVGEEVLVHAPIAMIESSGNADQRPSSVEPAVVQDYVDRPLGDRQRAMNRSALGGRLDAPIPAGVARPLPWSLVEAARTRLRAAYPRLKFTDFAVFTYGVALATVDHEKFRSTLLDRGETVRCFDHVDLGFAVALPGDELATAVIERADTLAFDTFVEAMRQRHREVKVGRTQANARTTLQVSSLAGHEVTDAVPVVFPPAIATLFVGATTDGSSILRLAFDHRLINGVGAANFLQEIERQLEKLA